MSVATIWLFNWAIAYATPYLIGTGPGDAKYAHLGLLYLKLEPSKLTFSSLSYKVFFVWGACCLIGVFFTYFCVYEVTLPIMPKLFLHSVVELIIYIHIRPKDYL